jgi:hypothetical protein
MDTSIPLSSFGKRATAELIILPFRSRVQKMAESKLLELPYEKIAMAGGEMPKGLEYPDQILFLALRLLYDSYKRKMIDRDIATQEKVELLRTYEAHKIVDKMGKEWVDQIKRTELARAEYRKNKTIENADKMLACVEGGKYYG